MTGFDLSIVSSEDPANVASGGAAAYVIVLRLIRLLLTKSILTPDEVLGILARVSQNETRH